MKVCPECDGKGGYTAAGPMGAAWFDCRKCNGAGEVDLSADLPTVEQCREFLDKINEGRALIDLPPLDVLDFDGAEPEACGNCLSARNLFWPAGYTLCPDTISARENADRRVLAILDSHKIPAEILTVTDAFDATSLGTGRYWALRARMVEAGVVAP